MRKIVSKSEEKSKRKRNQIIVGLILVLIMFMSVVGYSFQGSSEEKTDAFVYGNFKFVKVGDYWKTTFENYELIFSYSPKEVENIDAKVDSIGKYSNKPLYLVSNNPLAESEIYRNMQAIVLRMQYACLEGEVCDGSLPTKTCEDNLIIIKEGEASSITQDENCTYIEGKPEELVKLSDEFLFKIFGIKDSA